MTAAPQQTRISELEYLEIELNSEFKNEFWDGHILAMSGGSQAHNQIIRNLTAAGIRQLGTDRCQLYSSDTRLLAADCKCYFYPDLQIICDQPEFANVASETVTNPSVIIEVLSKSTEAADRGYKFECYRTLPSLKMYVLVNSSKVAVDVHTRQEDGTWQEDFLRLTDMVLDLSPAGANLRYWSLTSIRRSILPRIAWRTDLASPVSPSRSGRIKEPFCCISHFAGAILSMAGLAALLVSANGSPTSVAAYLIYGISLILLYSLSALYHGVHVSPAKVRFFQKLDYIAIFLLIAGTYTPVCLVTLRHGSGIPLLAAIWSLAAVGILIILFWNKHPHWIRVALYVIMGWLAVSTVPALYKEFGSHGISWLVAGGLAYTLGIFFYAMDEEKPRPWLGKRTPHDIWHLFVLAGSACHYLLILLFVAAKATL